MVGRLTVLLAVLGCAAEATPAGLRVVDARAPAPVDTVVAAAYFTLINDGPSDTLVALRTPAARHATVHAGTTFDGRREMRPVPALGVPGGATRFAPGGLHVMLEDLTTLPVPGDTLVLMLTFRRAGVVTVAVPVVRYEDLEP